MYLYLVFYKLAYARWYIPAGRVCLYAGIYRLLRCVKILSSFFWHTYYIYGIYLIQILGFYLPPHTEWTIYPNYNGHILVHFPARSIIRSRLLLQVHQVYIQGNLRQIKKIAVPHNLSTDMTSDMECHSNFHCPPSIIFFRDIDSIYVRI